MAGFENLGDLIRRDPGLPLHAIAGTHPLTSAARERSRCAFNG